ncbi:MAG: polysaccharide deacetylase family protein, partial [Clostridia bacterium]|nr:polysaccharide deacetylase family protein [Clostridia bacterium]
GYENGNIEKILDVMKEEGVTGAFFILKNLILKNPDLVCRMASDGHLVCNHTATHKDMTKCSSIEEFKEELASLEKIYAEATGKTLASYYRPPEGKFDEASMKYAKELGYKTVFWSFAYADWDNDRQMSPQTAKQKILSNVHNGEVMLLHPTSATNAAILKDVIRELKNQGYRFGTLDELTAK